MLGLLLVDTEGMYILYQVDVMSAMHKDQFRVRDGGGKVQKRSSMYANMRSYHVLETIYHKILRLQGYFASTTTRLRITALLKLG